MKSKSFIFKPLLLIVSLFLSLTSCSGASESSSGASNTSSFDNNTASSYNHDYSATVSRVEPSLGLRWHTFLTKILWLGIALSALGGIRTLYEAFFNEEYFELFNNYPTVRVIEILYGLLKMQ